MVCSPRKGVVRVTTDAARSGDTSPGPAHQARASSQGQLLETEPGTADLKVKVDKAWREFARGLGAALPALPDGFHVAVTLDPTASGTGDAVYEVSLAAEHDEFYVDAVSNASLPEGYRLDRAAIADLVALGWSPPGVVEGSGDRFGMRASREDAETVAVAITRTMRDVYGAPHPAFLTYAVSDDDEVLDLPPLGSARPAPLLRTTTTADSGVDRTLPLTEQVRTVVARMLRTEPERLHTDSEEELGIRAGSAMVFVRVHDNPPLIDVYSPILTGVKPNERLYERLSQLQRRMPIGRLYCTDDTVWASVAVFGRNFQPTHLMLAVQVMTRLADELDDRLQGDFGGHRFFGEGDRAAISDKAATVDDKGDDTPDSRTGMYL